MKHKKLGLALGGGSARGLSHIGILKVLHKYKIDPDYIAGTSMGAVIGAMYAAGHSPEEIEAIAKTTDWNDMINFTIPKSGLIQGNRVERKIRKLVFNKEFKQLCLPLKIVSYNLTNRHEVIFDKGDVAKAVRASISIPGIFAPVKIKKELYIDGGISNPTPFDVVRAMGADVIIAVDLLGEGKSLSREAVKDQSFMEEMKKKFITDQLANIEKLLFPEEWPKFLLKILRWGYEKILYPRRILKIIAGKEMPEFSKVMYQSMGCLIDNLSRERMKHADVDIKIIPNFNQLDWTDFDQVDKFIKMGEIVMEKDILRLKRKLS